MLLKWVRKHVTKQSLFSAESYPSKKNFERKNMKVTPRLRGLPK